MRLIQVGEDRCEADNRKWGGQRSYSYLADRRNVDGRTLAASEAVSERTITWKRYLVSHLVIQEEPTDDPQITNVQVSIDLNDVCRVGRHQDDLLSN